MHSFFLVIEGLDGTGKSEVSRHLTRMLRQTMGERVLLTFEPHDPSAAGLFIRQALTKRIRTSARALALAYALNRVDHNERAIQPFLEGDGARVVISDRYYLSSLVYQSTAEQPFDALMTLNATARRPDLTLFLSASARTCYERMRQRAGDRELFDSNLNAMRAKYAAAIQFLRARGETILEVSAEDSLPTVLNRVIDTLRASGPGWLEMQRILIADAQPDRDADANPMIDYDGMIAAFIEELPPMRDKKSVRAALTELKRRVVTEIERMSAGQLGALLLTELARRGYEIGDALAWGDVSAYEIDYPMRGVNLKPHGVALLMRESGRYGVITRKLQALEDQAGERAAEVDFVIALDPAPLDSPAPFQYRRDYAPRLFPQTEIVGRDDLYEWVWAAACDAACAELDDTLRLHAQALMGEV